MFSTLISRVSAAALALGGLALLFASDVLLPAVIPGLPPSAAWLGQLLAAAWLAVATLNWLSQSTLLGGIYGRAVVATNTTLYFVSAMVLLKAVTRANAPLGVWIASLAVTTLAITYGWLLFRGPLTRDVEIQRGAT